MYYMCDIMIYFCHIGGDVWSTDSLQLMVAAPCLVWECARVLGAVAFELVVAVLRIEMLCLHPGRLELRGEIWGYHGKIHGGLRGFQWGSTVKAGDQMEIS